VSNRQIILVAKKAIFLFQVAHRILNLLGVLSTKELQILKAQITF